jgi:hypothetical protein
MGIRFNRFHLILSLSSFGAVWHFASLAMATLPYTPVTAGSLTLGPGIVAPSAVFGKEYSHDFDSTTIGAGAMPPPPASPEQIIAWDGIGGALDGVNYAGTRMSFPALSQVDAIANHTDALFDPLRDDMAHLIFSVDDMATSFIVSRISLHVPVVAPSAGPILLANGNSIGGAGEISYELGTAVGNPANSQGLWATQAMVNGMPLPTDVDGLEVWGPEPGVFGDADRYSLATDIMSFGAVPMDAVSVWNFPSGTDYIRHSTIASAVTSLLGPIPTALPNANINLDALMVLEIAGDDEEFGRDPMDPMALDKIIFSITQIPDPSDPSGYYATGSELFVLDGAGGISYLVHGGHTWDRAYALANLVTDIDVMGSTLRTQLDINAIEAVGEAVVPEPSTVVLMVVGLFGVAAVRRRRR